MDLDSDDLAGLIQTGYSMAAAGTQFPGFEIERDEAHLISDPLARILSRHPEWAEAVAKTADPVALVIAVFTVTAPRIAAFAAYREDTARRTVASQPAAASPPPPNGANGPARERVDPRNGSSFVDPPPEWTRGF